VILKSLATTFLLGTKKNFELLESLKFSRRSNETITHSRSLGVETHLLKVFVATEEGRRGSIYGGRAGESYDFHPFWTVCPKRRRGTDEI
jgi:hypothetical protein